MRLVGHQDQATKDGHLRIVCGRCGKPLYDFDGNVWRYLKEVRETAD
jgi:hypothetical protein